MKRIQIETDEWYPVYSICDDPTDFYHDDESYEVTEEFIIEYWETMIAFTNIQSKLQSLLRRSNV